MSEINKGNVWALFENGEFLRVSMETVDVEKGEGLVIDRISNIQGVEAISAVKKALETVYGILKKYNKLKANDYGIKCGLQGNGAVYHESASLAFGLALVVKHLGLSCSIAATGIIDAYELDSKIQPVDSINNKVKAAINAVDTNGFIFIPCDNVHDTLKINQLSKQVRDLVKFSPKKITLIPVASLEQAVKKLLTLNDTDTSKSKNSKLKLMLWTAVCLILIWFLYDNFPNYIHFLKSNQLVVVHDPYNLVSRSILQSPGPIEKKPVKKRFRINLKGDDEAVQFVSNVIKSKLPELSSDLLISNQEYDGSINGNVVFAVEQGISNVPFAEQYDQDVFVVKFSVHNMEIEMKNGDIIFAWPLFEITKELNQYPNKREFLTNAMNLFTQKHFSKDLHLSLH